LCSLTSARLGNHDHEHHAVLRAVLGVDVSWTSLPEQLSAMIAERSIQGGNVAVAARDLVAGQRVSIAAERVFSSASLIKVPIMVAALQEAESGRLPLSRQLRLDAVPRVGGSGVLAELTDLDRLSVRDLLTLMIVISDNLATNLLIDAIGMAVINRSAAAAGLAHTRLRRTMMDLEARRVGLENHTTATDMTLLLEQIAIGRGGLFGSQESCAVARHALARQQLNDRLPRHLPAGACFAHKSGELAGIRHDAGYLLVAGRPVLALTVLTEGFGSADDPDGAGPVAADLVADIGRFLHRSLGAAGMDSGLSPSTEQG
jgi:beta-lactamase class A